MDHRNNRDFVENDPLLALRGSGKDLWADENADNYVRRLRESVNPTRHCKKDENVNPHGRNMAIGDRVKLVGIPSGLSNDSEFKTADVFQKCLNRTFTISSIERVEGLAHAMIGLDIGEVLGEESFMETIYVEPEHLELEN